MTARGGLGRFAIWTACAALVMASAGAMIWIWRSGGVSVAPAQTSATVEECDATVSGSTAMAARLAPELAAAFLRHGGYDVAAPEILDDGALRVVGARGDLRCTITVRGNTSTQGLRDLASGASLVALSQRPMTLRDIAMLAGAGAGDFAAERALAEHVVAFDAYAVVVHADNGLDSITIDDVRDVALGQITNWSELGGTDAPITLYAAQDGVGPEDYPNDLVQHPNPDWIQARIRARVFANELEAVAALANDPTGFGFLSGAFARKWPGVRALDVSAIGPAAAPTAANVRAESYPLARRLFAYARPEHMRSNAFVQAFVAYFTSPEAFNLVDEQGFVALRPTSRLSQAAASLSGCRFGTAEYSALMSATLGASRLALQLRFNPRSLQFDDETNALAKHLAGSLRGRLATGAAVILVGHADYTGDVADNRAIALRRALAARTAFEGLGVFGLEVESAGEICPIADNQTEEGRERNRRVEVWVRPGPGAAPGAAQ